MSELTWAQLDTTLKDLGSVESASGVHGHLVGRHIAGHALDSSVGLTALADASGLAKKQLRTADRDDDVPNILQAIALVLGDDVFDFDLLLPHDEHALSVRTQALGDWVQGFLVGMASSSALGESGLAQEERESLDMLAQISQISDEVSESEEDENNFVELSHFVRLAVMHLRDEFAAFFVKLNQESDADSIH